MIDGGTDETRWYVMHGHGDLPRHVHSTANRHDGSTPNAEHIGIPTQTWEDNRAERLARVGPEYRPEFGLSLAGLLLAAVKRAARLLAGLARL